MTTDSKLSSGRDAGDNSLPSTKPRILLCASPATGHTTPVIKVCRLLVDRGFRVSFLAADEFKNAIESAGAEFISLPAYGEFDAAMVEQKNHAPGPERIRFDLAEFFIKPTKQRMEYMYKALEDMKAAEPSDEIILMPETWFLGDQPLYLGAPLPKGFTKRPRSINLHACLYMIPSTDAGPFGMCIIPETSEESKKQYAALHEQMRGFFSESSDYQEKIYLDLGAKNYVKKTPFETICTSSDISLHLFPPSIEHSYSDWHPKVRVIGALPPSPPQNFSAPSFWNEVTDGQKKIVVVTQGTVRVDHSSLITPAMQSLADRDDILVVAVLGIKGATLPEEVKVPKNARIVDHLAYDAILPFASVFILNAGFGGFIHGITNGVPMVLAGESEDKAENALRGELAGVGINLKTQSPTAEQISNAVTTILSNDQYKKRSLEIKEENDKLQAAETIEKTILEQAKLAASED